MALNPKKKIPAVKPDATARPINAKTDDDVRREASDAQKSVDHELDMWWWPNRSSRPNGNGPATPDERSHNDRIDRAAKNLESVQESNKARFRDREHWAKAMFEGYEEPSQYPKGSLADELSKIKGLGVGRTEAEARANLRKK